MARQATTAQGSPDSPCRRVVEEHSVELHIESTASYSAELKTHIIQTVMQRNAGRVCEADRAGDKSRRCTFARRGWTNFQHHTNPRAVGSTSSSSRVGIKSRHLWRQPHSHRDPEAMQSLFDVFSAWRERATERRTHDGAGVANSPLPDAQPVGTSEDAGLAASRVGEMANHDIRILSRAGKASD